jgi:hypothetical protein
VGIDEGCCEVRHHRQQQKTEDIVGIDDKAAFEAPFGVELVVEYLNTIA